MDLAYVKKLIKLLSDSGVDEIEIEEQGNKIRLVKHQNSRTEYAPPPAAALPPPPPAAAPPVAEVVPATPSAPAPAAQALYEIKSPIVGTFYRSPAPEAPPFIQVGSAIAPGAVLCIVEAMKLMNEIESDVSGTVVKIMVENGQPVEYDQTLFLVETA